MTPAERALRLVKLQNEEADAMVREEIATAAARKSGDWRWNVISAELQFRNRQLPTLRLDLTRTEAADLLTALARALGEPAPQLHRASAWMRFRDWVARRAWNKSHQAERRAALRLLADEFKQGNGW